MIIYQSDKEKFTSDILGNRIEQIIQNNLLLKTGKHVGNAELQSWKESLRYMGSVLHDPEIPADSGISIEYHIPQTSKRIDFIISGQSSEGIDHAVLIELKQWSEVVPTQKDGIVVTRFRNGEAEVSHPSYQAWSYSVLLNGFNEEVYAGNIRLKPCAYLHNFHGQNAILDSFYQRYIDEAPVFLAGADEEQKLRNFIKEFVRYGDKTNIMYRIENGRIRPSKVLADSLAGMLSGKQEFVMIDEQKLIYEQALALSRSLSTGKKHVLIVEGGPGTGKTVVAINLLVNLTKHFLNARYVTKNAAPRAVYESKLTGMLRKSEISNFFSGSGSFMECDENAFDVLIVDEAHRLNEKSGMFKNLGENQVKELIHAAKLSIFFIDEDQRVTWNDIGQRSEIVRWASRQGAEVHEAKLESQFRCNGSDGYLAWLDSSLQIRYTANYSIGELEYDFQVIDSPNELRRLIEEKNKNNNKSRIVAGYCWDWVSKKFPEQADITIPEHDFRMKWNLTSDGSLWILGKDSVKEAGVIHTCQGLELDYIGVIIGDDLVVRNGSIVTNPKKRARTDTSLHGFSKEYAANSLAAARKADMIIKNTYRTLMTRGMKGCYIFCTDMETQEYFKTLLVSREHAASISFVDEFEDFDLGVV